MSFNMKELYRKEQSIIGCNSVAYTPETMGQILKDLVPEFEQGKLLVDPDEKLVDVPLQKATEAYEHCAEIPGVKRVIVMN